VILSRSARLCEAIIRQSRARKGGVRECGRPYLARRLGCSTRQVSRYVAELREAGRLHVTPPRRVRTSRGWRTAGVNAYRLPCQPHPAPHIRRSGRDDTGVLPPLTGSEGTPPGACDPPPLHDPRAAIAAVLARHGLTP
jgi:hypothetical protein